MSKIKTEFNIEEGYIEIWPVSKHNSEVAIRIVIGNRASSLSGKDLERFAVNILKALKSKHLKQ